MGTPYSSSFRSLCESGLDADEAGAPDFSVSARCFCCFCRKLSASDRFFAAENLERERLGKPENSENPTAAH
jgi:hypothetical protein